MQVGLSVVSGGILKVWPQLDMPECCVYSTYTYLRLYVGKGDASGREGETGSR